MIVEQFAFDYTVPGVHERDFGVRKIIGKELTRNFPDIYDKFMEELRIAVDEVLGVDPVSWRTLNIYSAMRQIISRPNLRVILGEPLCRDKAFVYHAEQYVKWFGFILISVGQLLPQAIRPIFGIILGLPLKYHRWFLVRRLRPVFEERLELLRRMGITCTDGIPKDAITWTTKVALESKKPEAQDPGYLALQFVESTFTTSEAVIATATNFFCDVLSSESENILRDLREEAQLAFFDMEIPNMSSIKRLHLVDSALRETLRRNPFSIYGLFHEVMPKEGVVIPSGHHLPQGTWVCVPTLGIHHDNRLYSEPKRYNPYRFTGHTNSSSSKTLLTVITESFLGFSSGNHSCPGRVYASHLLKSMIAYIMMNYEFRQFSTRPLNRAVGVIYVPPVWTKFSFRRTSSET
ncbi:cytochrome P450 [Aspergillus pseudocaelatus]|uniref:Cytochrome P450 n=1 Tax=Aspergillus pseudocaelatus TaxID=1825620 RepID=A0ABQ6W7Y0_9EURO|nr:cytochrome P450 [Aspergillus pseudocaelatus]